MTDTKELIEQVKQIAESGVADYLNVGYQNSEILTKAADAPQPKDMK